MRRGTGVFGFYPWSRERYGRTTRHDGRSAFPTGGYCSIPVSHDLRCSIVVLTKEAP